MFIGWAISSLSMLFLLMTSDLGRIEVDGNDNYNENGSSSFIPSENAPSVQILTLSLLVFGIGFWFADVMGDSIVAEKAKLEPEHSRGHLQSTCYACRFFGLMVAAPISTYLYSTVGPQIVIKLMCILPLMMLIPIYNLFETKDAPISSTRDQCNEIWKTVCSRAVWQPMGFVYIYNVLQIGNAAWREFLLSVLMFQDWQLNILLVVAHVLLYLGVMAYKVSFKIALFLKKVSVNISHGPYYFRFSKQVLFYQIQLEINLHWHYSSEFCFIRSSNFANTRNNVWSQPFSFRSR